MPEGEELILTVAVSNYLHRNGGLWHPFILGEASAVQQERAGTVAFEMFLVGALCIMGLYQLGLFALRRRDRSNLYFGLLCLVVSLRTVLTGERLLLDAFPEANWTILLHIEYLTVFLGMPIFIWFTQALFPLKRPYLVYGFQGLGILFSTIMFLTEPPFFTSIILYFQLAAFVTFAIMGGRVALGIWQKEESATLFLVGLAVIMVVFLADVLSANEVTKLPFIFPLGLFIFIFVHSFMLSMRFARAYATVERLSEELTHINKALHRFVPAEFLQLLNKQSIVAVRLGDNTRMEMSVLFSDIRSFTTLSEQMTPDENFEFINTYLKQMVPAIAQQRGFIDKYIGDAIMALFPESAEDAVRAGVEMLHSLAALNLEREARGQAPIRIGIGINTGPLMLGMVGGQERMDGTVIGDTVNLASRIEGLTGRYGASLLVAGRTLEALPAGHPFTLRLVDRVRVKGKRQPVDIYEVLDGEPPLARAGKQSSLEPFARGVRAWLEQDLETARASFTTCLTLFPGDRIAALYLERIEKTLEAPPVPGWDPVLSLDAKS